MHLQKEPSISKATKVVLYAKPSIKWIRKARRHVSHQVKVPTAPSSAVTWSTLWIVTVTSTHQRSLLYTTITARNCAHWWTIKSWYSDWRNTTFLPRSSSPLLPSVAMSWTDGLCVQPTSILHRNIPYWWHNTAVRVLKRYSIPLAE